MGKTSLWKLTGDVRKQQMVIKLFGHGHSHAETTPNEAFSDTQVPCTAGCYQSPPSPQDRVHYLGYLSLFPHHRH